MSKLDDLKSMTTVVADTGDFDAIRRFAPRDATTNPSLLLKAAQQPQYGELLDDALAFARGECLTREARLEAAMDKLAVNFGTRISEIVPGYVSTEADARLSFDTRATIDKAQRLLGLYAQQGVETSRILIKIASTWEGIQAARELQKEGVNCNMTLLFSFPQAVACADAGAFLVSPFVGRILDWYRQATGEQFSAENDPGVASVRRIYRYYKAHGYATIVMGASFRNKEEIEQLAGCDRLTISPALLEELDADSGSLEPALDPGQGSEDDPWHLDEAGFRWHLNQDPMATEKLSEGIRRFHADYLALRDLLDRRL